MWLTFREKKIFISAAAEEFSIKNVFSTVVENNK